MNPAPPNDAGIPLLTEVLDLPPPPKPAGIPVPAPALVEPEAPPPVSPAPVAEIPEPATADPTPTAPTAQATADEALTAPTASTPPAIDEDALLDRLRAPILRDIHDRLNPLLEARAHAAVAAQVNRIADDIAAALREELTRMIGEALHKELIRQEAEKTRTGNPPPQ